MEIWPNPLNLNLSQFQEEAARGWKTRCNWISSPIWSLTGWTPPSPTCCWEEKGESRAILTRPSNVWNISWQLTQLTLGWLNLTVHTYLALGKPFWFSSWRRDLRLTLADTLESSSRMSSLVSQEPTLASIPESPTMTEEHRNMWANKSPSSNSLCCSKPPLSWGSHLLVTCF